mmetsp:Transcript_2948/g.9964  ORF Transcript_2948/g.9964 Transcript_2948/m.9964 type:complete len:218 (+) Transcript_2948:2227-2880(+)
MPCIECLPCVPTRPPSAHAHADFKLLLLPATQTFGTAHGGLEALDESRGRSRTESEEDEDDEEEAADADAQKQAVAAKKKREASVAKKQADRHGARLLGKHGLIPYKFTWADVTHGTINTFNEITDEVRVCGGARTYRVPELTSRGPLPSAGHSSAPAETDQLREGGWEVLWACLERTDDEVDPHEGWPAPGHTRRDGAHLVLHGGHKRPATTEGGA